MAQAVLVNDDIEAGKELLRVLDANDFPVTGAVWIYFPDIEEWRLVVRTPRAEKNLQAAYLDMAVAMDAAGDLRLRIDLSRVKLVPPSDRMLQAMGRAIRANGVNTIRLSRSMINAGESGEGTNAESNSLALASSERCGLVWRESRVECTISGKHVWHRVSSKGFKRGTAAVPKSFTRLP